MARGSRRIAVQMDPIESINIDGDSTFSMLLEAQARGYAIHYYGPNDLCLDRDKVLARARRLSVRRVKGDHFTVGVAEDLDLSQVDVVLMRQDPPFDMGYISATHMLEQIHPQTLVVNDPAWVRNCPEKLFVTQFPDLMPATLITRDIARIRAFRETHRDIILKPLYGNGGMGVFHVTPDDENLGALLETFALMGPEPIVAQQYLPAIRQGDKRIILVDGEPAGAIDRIPQTGEARANMHAGGVAQKAALDDRDREICARIGPILRERGLIFVGIDVIGGMMTEINVTSPTGIQEIDRYDGVSLAALIWDAIERRLGA